MKVFMLGWEFPPIISGGLGVACYGLAKALNSMGVDVMFVLPRPAPRANGGHARHGFGILENKAIHTRTLVQVRQVTAPTPAQAHDAVERAANGKHGHGHAVAPMAQVRLTPAAASHAHSERQPEAGTPVQAAQPTGAREGMQDPPLKRVTFLPVDVRLEPYMTPAQYFEMVVEEQPGGPQAAWAERAVQGGAHGRPVQPPNSPQMCAATPSGARHSGETGTAPPALHQREYIDEPAETSRVMGLADTTYAGDLFSETERYARLALAVATGEQFAVVHAHDWMTFEAAMAVAAASEKPLVVQIHSTELDRAGASANRHIMEIERKGMMAAERVIAVSYKTRTQLIEKYGIDPQKIEVVYNATEPAAAPPAEPLRKKQRTVLFLGRLTEQKGPDYFLRAAKKVLAVEKDVKFVVAGKGEMLETLKKLADELGIKKKVTFTGFLKKDPVEKAFRSASVYVMPSLSEPFGITPLEALSHDVPVIISRQSGVAEVLRHVLKVDFWDTDDLANKIIAVLRHPPLAMTLREKGQQEVRQLSWEDSARRIVEVYQTLSRQLVA